MEVKVLNISGKETSKTVSLNADIFGIEPNDHAIYLDVKRYLASQRQGTHKSKERAEIVGSTRKIKKQKGTGTARAGSIKNPLFRGGGRVFGPEPRDYSFKLNKKVKSLARKSAWSYKASEQGILVVEDFNFEKPKTKEFISVLNNLSLSETKTILILADNNNNVYLSSRNLKKVKVLQASQVSTYDLLNAKKVILSESAVQKIEELF